MRNYAYKKKNKKKEVSSLLTDDGISLIDIDVEKVEGIILSMKNIKYYFIFVLLLYLLILINFSYKDYIRFQEEEKTITTFFGNNEEMPVTIQKEKGYISYDNTLYVLSNSLYAKSHHKSKELDLGQLYKIKYVEYNGVRYIKYIETINHQTQSSLTNFSGLI